MEAGGEEVEAGDLESGEERQPRMTSSKMA